LKDENPNPRPQRIRQAVSLALPVAAALIVVYVWWPHTNKPAAPDLPPSQAAAPADNAPSPHDLPPGHPTTTDNDSLLQQMAKDSGPDAGDLSGPAATTAQLESQYSIIADSQEQLNKIRSEVAAAAEAKNKSAVQQGVERGKPLMALLNARLAAFQKDLTAARRARPNDPVVQWLTGELFMIVGGEPDAFARSQFARWRDTVDRVLEATKPGATGADLVRAGTERDGTRPWLSYFYLAHGTGTDPAEMPLIGTDRGNEFDASIVLAPGMVLVLEPVVWDDGHCGHRSEEIVAITDDGYTWLSSRAELDGVGMG